MRISILVSDANVAAVRAAAISGLKNYPKLIHANLLSIPVSPTGDLPVTHWFCNFEGSDGLLEKLLALQNLSEIAVADATDFLTQKNLKYVLPK